MIDVVSGCAPPVIGAQGCLPHGGQQCCVVFRKECRLGYGRSEC